MVSTSLTALKDIWLIISMQIQIFSSQNDVKPIIKNIISSIIDDYYESPEFENQ